MGFITDKIKQLLNDPVYDNYHLFSYVDKRGEIKYSAVLNHNDSMIYRSGLDVKMTSRDIKSYQVVGVGSEDDITDLKYACENR